MITFTIGQRWVSQSEPELGLGVLFAVDKKTIQIRFAASDTTRHYSPAAAPLKRVIFNVGDRVRFKNETELKITAVNESDGLIYYTASGKRMCETDLCDTLSFSMPQDRLLAGIIDPLKLFDLRYRLLKEKGGYDGSRAKGFIGGQIDLLPHQFYIADTVTSRFVPRVLLADETGLGKTIEAGLILHKLLILQKINRVLIIVPEALQHQWFVELYRKFNLSFMLFDEAFCQSFEKQTNPFLERQLGIISIDLLKSKKRQTQILNAGWDMIVIDEAHHITEEPDIYRLVQHLAAVTSGMMLLTATPEQMGLRNHFLHLQLIDPDRYFDFDTFCNETDQYQHTMDTIKERLKSKKPIDHLLDTYGPGRVIFKNKRKVIKGFPKRITHMIPLRSAPRLNRANNLEIYEAENKPAYDYTDDPRTLCLVKLIKENKKVLVICGSKQKTMALDTAIAAHLNTRAIRFDETMTLMQRDRHAAWFAQPDGARVLICSEIGSEGRNFQFAHHLFLFDLPLNPELLEQRIGRLDRIGQKHDIRIHVPYLKGSAYEILARWYQDGLDIFNHHIDGVHLIFEAFKVPLFDLLNRVIKKGEIDESALTTLIQDTQDYYRTIKNKLETGRNLLLELNSFQPEKAEKIIQHIKTADTSNIFPDLIIHLWDHFGIETDFFSQTLFKLDSGAMTDDGFPIPPDLAGTMTFDRPTALARDEIDLVTWDHPFVQQTVEYFITNGCGISATALLPGQDAQGLLLESIYVLENIAPLNLNMEQYLSPKPMRVIVDHYGNAVTKYDDFDDFSEQLLPDSPDWFKDMEQVYRQLIPSMIDTSGLIAKKQAEQMIEKSGKQIKRVLGHEIDRLVELKKSNPGVMDQEIKLAKARMEDHLNYLSTARPRLDAIRLIRVQDS